MWDLVGTWWDLVGTWWDLRWDLMWDLVGTWEDLRWDLMWDLVGLAKLSSGHTAECLCPLKLMIIRLNADDPAD